MPIKPTPHPLEWPDSTPRTKAPAPSRFSRSRGKGLLRYRVNELAAQAEIEGRGES